MLFNQQPFFVFFFQFSDGGATIIKTTFTNLKMNIMKRNFALSLILLAGMFAVMFTSCKKDDDDENEVQEEVLSASFTFVGDYRPTPGDVIFTNKSKKAVSYHWDFGDSTTSEEENPTHTYEAMGEYTVVLTATDADGATKTAEKTVEMLGKCNYYTVEKVYIYKEAVTAGDGTEWDLDGSGVDLTFKIFVGDEEVFDPGQYASDVVFDDSTYTYLAFTPDHFDALPFGLGPVSKTYTIVLYDYEVDTYELEYITEAQFKVEDFLPTNATDPYPDEFEIETPHIKFGIYWPN